MFFKKINVKYNWSIFLNANYSECETSCIKHQVHELTDIHENYGGFPKTYTYHNTKINQLWWDRSQIDFDAIGQQLGMDIVTISSIRQPPGCVIPWHRDTFFQINQRFPDRTDLKVRTNIYLENWKMGHFIQHSDNIDTHWHAGQGLMWDSEVLHLGANAGFEPKHTLQISGFLLDTAV
jgi:hypothetical protein